MVDAHGSGPCSRKGRGSTPPGHQPQQPARRWGLLLFQGDAPAPLPCDRGAGRGSKVRGRPRDGPSVGMADRWIRQPPLARGSGAARDVDPRHQRPRKQRIAGGARSLPRDRDPSGSRSKALPATMTSRRSVGSHRPRSSGRLAAPEKSPDAESTLPRDAGRRGRGRGAESAASSSVNPLRWSRPGWRGHRGPNPARPARRGRWRPNPRPPRSRCAGTTSGPRPERSRAARWGASRSKGRALPRLDPRDRRGS